MLYKILALAALTAMFWPRYFASRFVCAECCTIRDEVFFTSFVGFMFYQQSEAAKTMIGEGWRYRGNRWLCVRCIPHMQKAKLR